MEPGVAVVTAGSEGRLRPPPEQMARTARTRPLDPSAPLQRVSLELARRCNLACTYCYSAAVPDHAGGLDDAEVRFVIQEAIDCGARAVSFVAGGESLLRRSILVDGASCIDFANALGAYAYLYTNGTLVNERAARWLARRDVTVVGKLNSLRDEVQDELAGVRGSARLIRRGVDELLRAGLSGSTPSRLGLQTIICRRNYDEIPELWRWMRARNVVPEVEIPKHHGRAVSHQRELFFAPDEAPRKYQELFEHLLRIDQREYGFDWIPRPPFAAGSCLLHYGNVYINDRGGVQPCAGIDAPYGFLRVGAHAEEGRPLRDIVTSPAVLRMRRVTEHIGGACKTCELHASCYGCRGAAYHAEGDMFAEDPTCWRAQRRRAALRLLG